MIILYLMRQAWLPRIAVANCEQRYIIFFILPIFLINLKLELELVYEIWDVYGQPMKRILNVWCTFPIETKTKE